MIWLIWFVHLFRNNKSNLQPPRRQKKSNEEVQKQAPKISSTADRPFPSAGRLSKSAFIRLSVHKLKPEQEVTHQITEQAAPSMQKNSVKKDGSKKSEGGRSQKERSEEGPRRSRINRSSRTSARKRSVHCKCSDNDDLLRVQKTEKEFLKFSLFLQNQKLEGNPQHLAAIYLWRPNKVQFVLSAAYPL